jgi:hypothetical protein
MSTPTPVTPTPEPAKKRGAKFWLLIVAGVIALLFFGYAVGQQETPAARTTVASEPGTTYEPEPDVGTEGGDASEEPSSGYTPAKSDWILKIKVTDKQCFGDAGCNVTLQVVPKIKPERRASLPDSGELSITYKLMGDESGPVIGTTTIDLSEKRSEGDEEDISPRSAGTKITATIKEIEYSEW